MTTTVSYKVHKTVYKPKDEWQIIPSTQEAIISEETWLRVQEIRENRIRPAATGRIGMFSGLAYCADCGAKLSFCAAKSLSPNQEHYRCSNYKSNRAQCQVHYIRELSLQKDERYIKMAEVYEAEQKSLTVTISDDEKKLAEMKQKTTDLRLLLQTLRKCTDITELNRDLVNRLIQRIEVHNNDKYDGHCHVKVDIYFTGAGIINIPTEQELLKLMDEIRNSRPNEQSA